MSRSPRTVLFAGRQDLFSVPGGDTEVTVALKRELTRAGVHIDFSHLPQFVGAYDLVHVFNPYASLAANAIAQGVPYVLTPMHEDQGLFALKSHAVVGAYDAYVEHRDRGALESRLAALAPGRSGGPSVDQRVLYDGAAAVLASGRAEAERIREDFGAQVPVEVLHLGFTRPADAQADPELFRMTFGVSEFVLCVGRLETRKNQLALLCALEHEDIPIVFVDGVTRQPAYAARCRRFNRRAPTIFTGSLSRQLLQSAYQAARVHALPSWYELPGLVSLEAAWWGCNVVASSWGTLDDYLGAQATYCEPCDPQSIRTAVLTAYERPRQTQARAHLEGFSWASQAEALERLYRRVLQQAGTPAGRKALTAGRTRVAAEQHAVQRRDAAWDLAQRDPRRAMALVDPLIAARADDSMVWAIRGVAGLGLGQLDLARIALERAIALQPLCDQRIYLYLVLVLLELGRHAEALEAIQRARSAKPFADESYTVLLDEYARRARPAVPSA